MPQEPSKGDRDGGGGSPGETCLSSFTLYNLVVSLAELRLILTSVLIHVLAFLAVPMAVVKEFRWAWEGGGERQVASSLEPTVGTETAEEDFPAQNP